MPRISNIYLPLIISILFSACQKVISVQLNSSSPVYMIEGVITDLPGTCKVSITQTKDFSGDNTFPGVSGAVVTVENNGVVTPLAETGTGVYSTNAINGTPGSTYNLKVSLNGVVYTASSTMPQPVGLNSIYVSKELLGNKNYITIVYSDPAGIKNYYRKVQYVNGHKEKTLFVSDDEFQDGLTIRDQLDFSNDTDDPARDIHPGDTVRVDMFCIDSTVHKYWSSLQQNGTGSGGSASPANPTSNIQGGCLGYFSAETIRSKTLVVPKS